MTDEVDHLLNFIDGVKESLYTETDLAPGLIDRVAEVVESVVHNNGYDVTQHVEPTKGRPPPKPVLTADTDPQPARGPQSWRWWHRIQGHKTRSRYDLIAPPYAWECEDCDVMYGHF